MKLQIFVTICSIGVRDKSDRKGQREPLDKGKTALKQAETSVELRMIWWELLLEPVAQHPEQQVAYL